MSHSSSATPPQPTHPAQDAQHLDIHHGFVAMLLGVSGTGKTTLGELLAKRLDADFMDADDFHSDDAKAKMQSGHALDDHDREPWLERIQKAVHDWRKTGKKVIFACSGLRKKYRQVLSELKAPSSILDSDAQPPQSAEAYAPSATAFSPFFPSPLYLFLLHAPEAVLMQRISARKGHYFPASLLQSQLQTLEWPGEDEDVMAVDVSMPKEQVVEVIAMAILKQHKGGVVGEHVNTEVNSSNAHEALAEPILPNPFASNL